MHKLSALLAASVMLLSVPALAADAPADAKPGQELHGFDKYWSKVDPTGKGFVTKDEWLAHAADRFKEIDTNGDGKISKEEMQAFDQKMMQQRMAMRQGMMNGQGGGMQGQPMHPGMNPGMNPSAGNSGTPKTSGGN